MKYVSSYFKALWTGLKIFGAVYLVISALEADKALSLFFVYVCVWMAIGGPLGKWIEGIEKENPIV